MYFRRRPGDRARERGVLDRPVPWAMRISLALLLPLGAALKWIVSGDPRLADAWMGTGYPLIARALGMLTGWLPFSVAEVLVLFGGLWLLVTLWRNVRHMRRGSRHLRNLVAHAVSGAAAMAGLCFVLWLTWSLGFHRTPLAERAGYHPTAPTTAELRALAGELLDETNQARRNVQEDGDGVMRLEGSVREGLLGVHRGFERAAQVHEAIATGYVGRVKELSLSSGLMTRAGLSGLFVTLTGEPGVNPELPAPALAFTACHEAAHQIGWAREEEAGFAGYLACRMHPDADFRYASRLAALRYSSRALARVDSQAFVELMTRRSPAVVRDWEAIDRNRGRIAWLAELGSRANDAYLRSQGQEAGGASHDRIVELLVAQRRHESGRPFPTP